VTQAPIARGSHSVRFFENEQDAYSTIAEYFSEGARLDDFCIMIARAGTFAGVRRVLAAHPATLALADRIRFVAVEDEFATLVTEAGLNRERAEEFVLRVLSHVPKTGPDARVRLYGELVDVFCERGRHAIALEMEDFARMLFALEPRLSIMCGYYVRNFAGEEHAAELRAVCSKHTDVGHVRDLSGPLAPNGKSAAPPDGAVSADSTSSVVYIVDDDPSMRRSLARLLTLSNFHVRVFDSAEAFLKEVDALPDGCLVLDIQLGGMTGLDLITLLSARGFRLPIIAMSGFHDERTECEALRLGARAFLHKPFEPQLLLDVIARAPRRA